MIVLYFQLFDNGESRLVVALQPEVFPMQPPETYTSCDPSYLATCLLPLGYMSLPARPDPKGIACLRSPLVCDLNVT